MTAPATTTDIVTEALTWLADNPAPRDVELHLVRMLAHESLPPEEVDDLWATYTKARETASALTDGTATADEVAPDLAHVPYPDHRAADQFRQQAWDARERLAHGETR